MTTGDPFRVRSTPLACVVVAAASVLYALAVLVVFACLVHFAIKWW